MEPQTNPPPPPPHIIVVPSPGMGHLIPLTEFAKRLVVPSGFTFTFAVPTSGPPSTSQTKFLTSAHTSTSGAIDHVFLPPVSLTDLPPDSKIETLFCHMMVRSIPSLRSLIADDLIAGKRKRPVVLLVDLFGTDLFELAQEFGLRPYIFFPSTAMTLSLFLYLNRLDKEVVGCEYREMTEPVRIPGCVPVSGKDLLDPLQDRKDVVYEWMLHHTGRYSLADGIIVNSFDALESGAIKVLTESEPGENKPAVYPIGPIVQTTTTTGPVGGESGIMEWLDSQPDRSVLYVSFGSGGALSCEQQHELALGLEMSSVRFLWVVRCPNDSRSNATYFGVDGEDDPLSFLPEGFLERVKGGRGRGMCVPAWAPQMRVLSHVAVGGFLSHCGWNSTLESVVNGVPFICWPLYAEQKMNAVMLVEDLRVGLRPAVVGDGGGGVYRRGEVARVVKELMEGEEGKRIRYRMKELKEAAGVAVGEGGSSSQAVKEICVKWGEL